MAITKTIDSIPTAPTRSDPDNFDSRADAFLTRIETLDDDLNEWADQCNSTQTEINTSETRCETYKNQAESAKTSAESARDTAQTHRDNAYKWAAEAEDTQVNDGTHTGYSAYHWATKAGKGELFKATSSTSTAIGTGSKTFTLTESNRAFAVGSPVRIAYTSNPANYYMQGVVTAYSGNSLKVDVDTIQGSGTFSSWTISLSGGITVLGSGSSSVFGILEDGYFGFKNFMEGFGDIGLFYVNSDGSISLSNTGTSDVFCTLSGDDIILSY